ncbi:MAG: hypothetical protein WA021_02890 [Minisyncoccia bacterium]
MKFFSTKNVLAWRHEPEAGQRFARTYWAVVMSLFMITVVAGLGFGVWEFFQPLSHETSEVTVGTPKTALNRTDIQIVLIGFDARAALFEERQQMPAMQDPS